MSGPQFLGNSCPHCVFLVHWKQGSDVSWDAYFHPGDKLHIGKRTSGRPCPEGDFYVADRDREGEHEMTAVSKPHHPLWKAAEKVAREKGLVGKVVV